MKKIIVVGSINMDLVATVDRMPVSGETLTGQSFTTFSGGKGANQAVAASRLGGDVTMVGRLGNDDFGKQLRRQLDEDGVDTSSVLSVGLPSGCAIILVDAKGANSIVVIPGANGSFDELELDAHIEALTEGDLILTQLEIPIETVVRLATIAEHARIPFILDPAPARPLSAGLLAKVSWITPNESETLSLLRFLGLDDGISAITQENARLAAERLLGTGVRNVILKMGSQGVYVAGQDVEATLIPRFEVDAVDTTAAGDAFNGGFAFALAQLGLPPVQAVRFACAVAAISVTRSGAQPSMPLLSEVEDLLRCSPAR